MKRTGQSSISTFVAEVVFLFVNLLPPQAGLATTFVLMNEETLALTAKAALIGQVTSVDPAVDPDDGSIHTYVSIVPDAILFGALDPEHVVLREAGGKVSERHEQVFGAPSYAVGERALVFVSESADGALHTTAMAMGKYHLSAEPDGAIRAAQTFDQGSVVLDTDSGAPLTVVEDVDLGGLLARISRVRAIYVPANMDELLGAIDESEPFTYLGKPSRWFEPDEGAPVEFLVCPPEGAPNLSDAAQQAVAGAFQAWSQDPLSTLELTQGDLDGPIPFQNCSGPNRVVFSDPFNEVDDPHDCSGVLAIGGYCALDHETRSINGQTFRRIRVGRVTFGDGWSECPFWNRCNLAEVATHEIGHAIGLGHSSESGATMAPVAQFDGRCAGLTQDDVAGLRALYPRGVAFHSPTPTRTPTHRAMPTERTTSTATPSTTKRPTRTPRYMPTESTEEPTTGVAETPAPTETPVADGMCLGDANGDHRVSIDEVIAVVRRSLDGCAADD